MDIPRQFKPDGRTPTGEPPGQGSLAERMRVFAKAVQRVERLIKEQVVPGGASGAAHRQRQLGALGLPSGVELTGVPRRPLFAGGKETERVLRRLSSAGDTAIGAGTGEGRCGHSKGWLEGVRPSYVGVQRGDAAQWATAAEAAQAQLKPVAPGGRAWWGPDHALPKQKRARVDDGG